jgi:putative methylase
MKINKKNLISIIQNTKTFISPKVELEQYCIDANSAVDLIYYAGFEFNDIKNALIIDLGAGTGRLSIASALFNATLVLSIDIDIEALTILEDNIRDLELDHLIHPICSDIKFFNISKRLLPPNIKATTIMNPPFGVQTRSADRIFLERAFSFSDVVYSLHIAGEKVQRFISNYIQKFDWIIDNILPFHMVLDRAFPFHNQKRKRIDVNVYRFIKKN